MTLEEVKTEACLNTLESLVGATSDNIDDLFNYVDVNNDGLVLESEVTSVLKDLAVDRTINPVFKPKCTFKWAGWNMKQRKYDCSKTFDCYFCDKCRCIPH